MYKVMYKINLTHFQNFKIEDRNKIIIIIKQLKANIQSKQKLYQISVYIHIKCIPHNE